MENNQDNPAPPTPPIKADSDINFFGATNFRNQNRKFGIKLDDRRRHMYVVGKTGMGKTTILENMVLNDIYAGHGVGLVDPHGDFAEKIIDYIPANRINDVVYFNPADINFPIGFNILETIRPEQKHLVASGLMGVFKKIWPDVWSARMEYILNNTILALLDFPGTTLLGINRMLADKKYRDQVVSNSKDPVIKAFWQTEFANYTDKFRSEAVSPIQNKIGQFLSASVIRNIVAQVKSRIDIREIMDNKKIFIMNLSKGRIGEDNSRLLGGMLITRIQLAAMERVDIPEKSRNDFFLYVDEFQNFATESFANILSEARKYRLDLIMAHQYMEQLDEMVLASVIGNVGTMVTFRVGSTDAEILAKEFAPTFIEEDLVNLPKFQVYLKLMIDGIASRPFSATTLPPIALSTQSTERVVKVSRERYATSREDIEEKVMRWSGMMPVGAEEAGRLEVDPEEEMFKNVGKTPAPARAPVDRSRLVTTRGGGDGKPAGRPFSQSNSRPSGPPRSHDGDGWRDTSQNFPKKNQENNKTIKKDGQRPRPFQENVLLGNPRQKGMSLAQATGASPGSSQSSTRPHSQPHHQPASPHTRQDGPSAPALTSLPELLPEKTQPKILRPGVVDNLKTKGDLPLDTLA